MSFQAALQFHIDLFGESYYHLHRAIFRDGDALEAMTLLSWLKGTKVPRSVANLEILNRVERRYRLPLGYFKETLPHHVKLSSADAAYNQTTFYEAWRLVIQRYGIYNPYTGRGAISGLLPHGPRNVRDVLATHIMKFTGSYEQASYAIQDTPEMVQQHCGRFLPQDKASASGKNPEPGVGSGLKTNIAGDAVSIASVSMIEFTDQANCFVTALRAMDSKEASPRRSHDGP